MRSATHSKCMRTHGMLGTHEIASLVEDVGYGFFSRNVLPDLTEARHAVKQFPRDADRPPVVCERFLREMVSHRLRKHTIRFHSPVQG